MRGATLLAAAGATVLLLAGCQQEAPKQAAKSTGNEIGQLANPPGITFQTVRVGREDGPAGASISQANVRQVYADPSGKTLYVFADDADGKATCKDECATAWPALIASDGAKPFGEWTLVARDDGKQQWAHGGKPLYLNAKDARPGDTKGLGTEKWSPAFLDPAAGLVLPYGVAIEEIPTAPGFAMVDPRGMPLYLFGGDLKSDTLMCGKEACHDGFQPFLASQLANPIGDFTVIGRADGVQQWAYKGQPLYTYQGDVEIGDSNGKGLDARWQLAMVQRFFMPAEVAIRPNQRRGGLLATLDDHTLYARDRVAFNGTGGHNARGGMKTSFQTGMGIGTKGCDAECQKTWKPLLAPADAQASGYWSIYPLEGGAKQWAYQGFALYTAADEKPGEVTAHDSFDMVVNDSTTKLASAVYGLGLYWRVTPP
jgi:predicted lipoprotein with Yx(FWY)xxD motif